MRIRSGAVAPPLATLPLAVLSLAVLLLTGCTSSPVGATPTPTASTTVTATPTPSVATPTTPPPTQNVSTATAVHLKCRALVPAAVVQSVAAGLQLDRGWRPDPGTPAARLADLSGTTCRWRDPTTGSVLEVAVAKPSKHDATALKNDLVERSSSVPTYGEEAYFQVVAHVGEVNAFRGRTWILARSNEFFEPGDATAVVQAVNTLLGGGPAPTPTGTATTGPTPPPGPAPAPTQG